jgi:hypothetical protein
MSKPKQLQLPQKIYVVVEGEPPEQYLSAQETPLGIEHGTKVGVYVLEEVKVKKITEELI